MSKTKSNGVSPKREEYRQAWTDYVRQDDFDREEQFLQDEEQRYYNYRNYLMYSNRNR